MVNPMNTMNVDHPKSPHSSLTFAEGGGGQAAGGVAGAPESGDFSFIVLDQSPLDSISALGNGPNSFHATPSMPPLSLNLNTPQFTPSLSIASIPGLSFDEVQIKLQEILQENSALKESLKQNTLALKQQFNTLLIWREDVLKAQKNHKESFEKTRNLVTKLKAENANLKMSVEDQPDVQKLRNDNEELKAQVKNVNEKLMDHEAIVKENARLRTQITQLEQRARTASTATEAQERAERRVVELNEERAQLLRENEELKNRVSLLQSELSSAQNGSFIMVETESIPSQNADTKKGHSCNNPDQVISSFCNALDQYDERISGCYRRLDQQVESFTALYGWLQDAIARLPRSSSAVDQPSLRIVLEGMGLRLREAQAGSTDHRLRLEQTGQQLGRLASDFQGLLQEWAGLNKELKRKGSVSMEGAEAANSLLASMNWSHDQVVSKLKSQLTATKEQLDRSQRALADWKAQHAKREALKNELQAGLGQAEEGHSSSEQMDRVTAQLMDAEERLGLTEKDLSEHKATIAKRDTTVAQLTSTLAKQEAAVAEKEHSLKAAEKKQKELEQKVDALSAQADVFKMDFEEERESRQQLASEKERLADELLQVQKQNKELAADLTACQAQLEENKETLRPAPRTSTTSRTNFNTIATPGRSRAAQPEAPEQSEPTSPMYECPICQLKFTAIQPLNNHVELCLEKDGMFP